MSHTRLLLPSLFFAALLSSTASAQLVRTFVASTGNDANPCSRTAPCRTLQAAFNAASSGGEVVALDSAGFGSNLVINKPISIIGPPGVYAGLTVFSGDGIGINSSPSDTVILRGLTIINQGSTGNGIVFNTGGKLQIEDCVVNGFQADGIKFVGPGQLFIKDTISRNNGGTAGIEISGSASVSIDLVTLEGNPIGIFLASGATATIRNSVASGNNTAMEASSAELNIENCLIANNPTTGVLSGPGATIRVAGSTVTDNGTGFFQFSTGVLLSRGNNTLQGNSIATQGTIGSFGAN